MSDDCETRGSRLSLVGLRKTYGKVTAIDEVSFQFAAGEFVSLLGPSGSGKSTILMAMAGFVNPDSGSILLDGRDITSLMPEYRDFGVVFQGYALFPHMTVLENIAYPLKLRGYDRKQRIAKAEDVMTMVHLGAYGDRMPSQLSGGQQQRVALARALVFDPKVVLLDEPLSALDKKMRGELQIELKRLHRRLGVTFVNVTHDQEEAMTMSDRIVVLRDGSVQQTGTPHELYRAPANRFVADFLGSANFFAGTVKSVRDDELTMDLNGQTVFHTAPYGAFKVGEHVELAVRPENIRTCDEGDAGEGDNRLAGNVVSFSYTGREFVTFVETSVGVIELRERADAGATVPQEGARVSIGWDKGIGRLLHAF